MFHVYVLNNHLIVGDFTDVSSSRRTPPSVELDEITSFIDFIREIPS